MTNRQTTADAPPIEISQPEKFSGRTVAIDLFCGLVGFDITRHMYQAYVVTCKATGAKYVGITTQGLQKRWNAHINGSLSGRQKTPLHRDIKRLGVDQFTIELVFSAFSLPSLLESEKTLIDQWDTVSPGGYNLARGGGVMAYTRTPESIERSASKHRGVPRDPAASERAAQKIRGTIRSPETREKMAAAKRGFARSPETREKISIARTGKSNNAGEINGQAKLTADQVREARIRLSSGESQRSVARSFGIHFNAIWKIANGVKCRSVA